MRGKVWLPCLSAKADVDGLLMITGETGFYIVWITRDLFAVPDIPKELLNVESRLRVQFRS